MKITPIEQLNIPDNYNIQDLPNDVLAISKDETGKVLFWKEQIL